MAFLMFDSSRFRFLSTPSARRATRRATAVTAFQYISIHALREEGDCAIRLYGRAKEVFLSTPSARRATHITPALGWAANDFYPRPPRGGRLCFLPLTITYTPFLSTPSARRATMRVATPANGYCNFYPRPPRGGRHHRQGGYAGVQDISIHALREEGDSPFFSREIPPY